MQAKKIAVSGVVLLVMLFCTVSSSHADEWPIQGTVVQAGMYMDKVYIVIKDTLDNYWAAYAVVSSEKEILATALTAFSSGYNVQGTYDTITSEWLDLFCYK